MDAVDGETAQLGDEKLVSIAKAQGAAASNDNAAAEQYRDKLLAKERAWFVRNARVAQDVRARAHGVCEACGNNVVEEYGTDIIEAHHRQAFATLPANTTTGPASDLAALCPSCHRALHRVSPSTSALLSVEQFVGFWPHR
jgi:predicted HNH restriction endonuclease